jgi:hypothetical protein
MATDTPTFESVLTDEILALVGTEGAPCTHEVTRPGVRAFARATRYTDRIYFDVEEAKRQGYRDLPAPPGHLGFPVFDPEKTDPIMSWPFDPNSRINHPFSPAQYVHTELLAGSLDLEYIDSDICAGDVLVSRTKLEDIRERYSKGLDGPMVIQTTATTFKRADKPVAIYRFTLIGFTPVEGT